MLTIDCHSTVQNIMQIARMFCEEAVISYVINEVNCCNEICFPCWLTNLKGVCITTVLFIGLGELVGFGGKVNSYACALHAFTI
jgi:hypothetical protein